MNYPVMAVAWAAVVGFALPAAAQCPASGLLGDTAGEPVPIVLRYAWKLADVRPTALKTALEKLPTVKRVDWVEKSNTAIVSFKGKCEQIAGLETAAHSAGIPAVVVSHAHVNLLLKTKPGADLKAAVDAIGKAGGVHFMKPSGAGFELHVDLSKLRVDELQILAEAHKVETQVTGSYEYLKFKIVEGNLDKFMAANEIVKGVLTVRREGDDLVGLWVVKAQVKPEQIAKTEGFKVERQ